MLTYFCAHPHAALMQLRGHRATNGQVSATEARKAVSRAVKLLKPALRDELVGAFTYVMCCSCLMASSVVLCISRTHFRAFLTVVQSCCCGSAHVQGWGTHKGDRQRITTCCVSDLGVAHESSADGLASDRALR